MTDSPWMTRAAAAARRPDPLLELLARMIRTAHDREQAERRGRLTLLEGGKGERLRDLGQGGPGGHRETA